MCLGNNLNVEMYFKGLVIRINGNGKMRKSCILSSVSILLNVIETLPYTFRTFLAKCFYIDVSSCINNRAVFCWRAARQNRIVFFSFAMFPSFKQNSQEKGKRCFC